LIIKVELCRRSGVYEVRGNATPGLCESQDVDHFMRLLYVACLLAVTGARSHPLCSTVAIIGPRISFTSKL
jgi:hypothetical protein